MNTIPDQKADIAVEIKRLVKRDCTILRMTNIDNKKIVLFSTGSKIGESEFSRGPNRKLKIEFARQGSNKVRYRIMTTNKGQYVRFMGENDVHIGKIVAFVEGEGYNIPVTTGDYFIETARLNEPTKSAFPSGSVWYDGEGKELYRFGISEDQTME